MHAKLHTGPVDSEEFKKHVVLNGQQPTGADVHGNNTQSRVNYPAADRPMQFIQENEDRLRNFKAKKK